MARGSDAAKARLWRGRFLRFDDGLHWDGGGFWIDYRVLEQGTFELHKSADQRLLIDATQLAMLLSGVSLVGVKRRKRYRRPARPNQNTQAGTRRVQAADQAVDRTGVWPA